MSIYIPHSPYASTTHYKPTQCSNMTPLSSAQSITTYFEKFEKNYQTTSNTRNFNNFIIDIKENTRQLIRGKSVSNSIHCNNPQKRPQTYKVYGTDVKDNKENEENLRRMKEKYLQKSIDRPIVEKYDRKNKEIEYFNFEKYTSPKNQSIKETEYISVEKLLNKDSRQKRADETFIKDLKHRPKSGKSCSTHLLSSQKFNELEAFHSPTYKSSQEKNQSQIYCPNSEKERKNYNIYSQNNIQREKNSKIVSIMKKIEGIQKNFDEHLFYKSLDYSIKSKEDENQTINESKTKQILKESKISENTPIPISNKANIYKKSNSYDIESMKSRPFFEKENESYADKNQLFSRINEKLYGQIINRRLEMQTKYEAAVKNTLTIAKFASFMSQDTPSQACSTPDCFKSENKTKNNSHNSHQFQNLPTKIDKTTFKSIATKNKNPKLSFRIGSLTTNLSIEDFQVGKCLGKGRFGSVFLAKDKRSEILVALKVVKKKTIKDSKMANQIKNEIKIQSCLSHPNVLKFFGFFQDEEQFYLILEYAPQGELYKKMKKQLNKRFEENIAAKYIKQVLEAVLYLHSMNVIHRDIKPENILISFDLLKLSDFGWATYSPSCKRQTFCGTLDYVPPEIVGGNEYSEKVDVWSLGILCYELCSGKPPFEKPSNVETFNSILAGKYQTPDFFSEEIKDFLKKILIREQDKRPNLNDLLEHPWIKKNCIEKKEDKNLFFNKLKLL